MNSYGQQFHQFQLNEQSLQIIEHKINPQNIALKIQVLVWDRHKNVLPYGGHGMIIVTQVALAYFYRYCWPILQVLLTYFYSYYWPTFLFETNDDCTKAVLSISTIDLENFICSSNDFVSALDWFFIFSSAAAIIGRKILNFVYN